MGVSNIEREKQKVERLGEERLNNQGSLMKIIKYIDRKNIIVQFQDEYKFEVKAQYSGFLSGEIKNPYFPSVHGVGIIGNKYHVSINGLATKEYKTWKTMLTRCFDKRTKERQPTYKDAICCKEWLLFENFYEWLHSQENFGKWLDNNNRWAIDKDILVKGNKVYSPETCCLVPMNVNSLFLKGEAMRGDMPIGVRKSGNKFRVHCNNPFTNKVESLGVYPTIEEAFCTYKQYKESIIKQVADIEYANNNISKECYVAMLNYKVNIDD